MRVRVLREAWVHQGDIFHDINYIEYAEERSGIVEVSKIGFPLIVVLTQDCDLLWDYKSRWSKTLPANQDKYLFSFLVAPMYNIEHVYDGNHLEHLNMKMAEITRNPNKSTNKMLKQNKNPRYHYLEFPPKIPVAPSVVDFKHYFTVNGEYLKKLKRTNFICSIAPLYRESLSQRFSDFLGRIALPGDE